MAYKGKKAKDILRDAAIEQRAKEAKRKREEEEKKAAEDTSESRVERIFRIVRSKLSEGEKHPPGSDVQHIEALKKAQGQPTFSPKGAPQIVPPEYYAKLKKPEAGGVKKPEAGGVKIDVETGRPRISTKTPKPSKLTTKFKVPKPGASK